VERSDPACHRSASAWKRSRWNRLYVYVLKLPKSSPRGSGEPAAPRRTAQENGPGARRACPLPPPPPSRCESILHTRANFLASFSG
jgi:hypothetical protein